MSRLTCYVYVTDDNGAVHGFGPGSTVPDWAREKITNPHAWAPGVDLPKIEEIILGAGGEGGRGAGAATPSDGPPPQGGTGATRQRWADYATSKGVEVEDDWKREDIIAACELAGVPV